MGGIRSLLRISFAYENSSWKQTWNLPQEQEKKICDLLMYFFTSCSQGHAVHVGLFSPKTEEEAKGHGKTEEPGEVYRWRACSWVMSTRWPALQTHADGSLRQAQQRRGHHPLPLSLGTEGHHSHISLGLKHHGASEGRKHPESLFSREHVYLGSQYFDTCVVISMVHSHRKEHHYWLFTSSSYFPFLAHRDTWNIGQSLCTQARPPGLTMCITNTTSTRQSLSWRVRNVSYTSLCIFPLTVFTDEANMGFFKLNKHTIEMFMLWLHLPKKQNNSLSV